MNVQILADSLNPNGRDRFTTFLIRFPKCLLAELNTHRMLVRNVGSSRAVPVSKMVKSIRTEPFIPKFTRNQSGMSGADNLTTEELDQAIQAWQQAAESAIEHANNLAELGIHKQNTNRLIEPFLSVELVLSGTEWTNFFNLRCHPDAQLDFKVIAEEMERVYNESTPKQLQYGEWHIPFGDYAEGLSLEQWIQVAIARIARVSYQTHDGEFSIEKDLELFNRLHSSKHMCYDSETEVLTIDGFKKLSEVTYNDKLATFNKDTQEVIFEIPQYLYIDDYKGKMYYVDNQQVNLFVTPNHRMLTSKRTSQGWESFDIERAEDIQGMRKYLKAGKYSSAPEVNYPLSLDLLGFFLGDGHADRHGKYVQFHLKKETKVKFITSFDNIEVSGNRYTIKNERLATWLRANCYTDTDEKCLPSDFLNMTKNQFDELCIGFKKSDGSIRRNTWVYSSTSEVLVNQIQALGAIHEIAVHKTKPSWTGNVKHKPCYRLNFSSRICPEVGNSQKNRSNTTTIELLDYDGKIYCATVSTGLLIVRRNNKVVISGNSPFEHVAKAVDNETCEVLSFSPMLTVRDFIDPKLDKFLFFDDDVDYLRWSRNYGGFYTYRHHLEDNMEVSLDS